MTDGLTVTLDRNDGSETFRLKVDSVEPTISNGLFTRSLISATGGLAGKDPILNKETYQITGDIKAMEASDYPNSAGYSDDDRGMEIELRRASKEWGPDTTDGFDTMTWDGRVIEGVITEFSPREDRSSDIGRNYTFSMEFTHIDVYIG